MIQVNSIVVFSTRDGIYGKVRMPGVVTNCYKDDDGTVYCDVDMIFPSTLIEGRSFERWHSWMITEDEIEAVIGTASVERGPGRVS